MKEAMNLTAVAEAVNRLAAFLGMRDISALTSSALKERYGISRVDVAVLFGGSILAGGDLLAEAMRNGVADRYVIVGGAGHTTDTLRERMREHLRQSVPEGVSEAELFAAYLSELHGLKPDLLECRSTNCGNNITYLLSLLQSEGIPCRSILLIQDASMQRRMDAGLRREASDILPINYAAYAVTVRAEGDRLVLDRNPKGMWMLPRYLSLLLGEIPRLRDDENGYGPVGRGFIAHVDIPREIEEAFTLLSQYAGESTRFADPRFASVKP